MMRDVIDVCFTIAHRKSMIGQDASEVQKLYVDVSKPLSKAWPVIDDIPSLGPKTLVYSYGVDMVMSGALHLRALGWGPEKISGEFKDDRLRELAGMSGSVPISTMFVAALYLNPWGAWWPHPAVYRNKSDS